MSESFLTSIDIAAAQDRVFDYFVRPELLVRWMGDFARLESTAGGLFSVDINGVLIRGHFVRVERPHLIEIAWGEAGNAEMPPAAPDWSSPSCPTQVARASAWSTAG